MVRGVYPPPSLEVRPQKKLFLFVSSLSSPLFNICCPGNRAVFITLFCGGTGRRPWTLSGLFSCQVMHSYVPMDEYHLKFSYFSPFLHVSFFIIHTFPLSPFKNEDGNVQKRLDLVSKSMILKLL